MSILYIILFARLSTANGALPLKLRRRVHVNVRNDRDQILIN